MAEDRLAGMVRKLKKRLASLNDMREAWGSKVTNFKLDESRLLRDLGDSSRVVHRDKVDFEHFISSPGPAGAPGPMGAPGQPGIDGYAGPAGEMGFYGDEGSRGPMGAMGAAGRCASCASAAGVSVLRAGRRLVPYLLFAGASFCHLTLLQFCMLHALLALLSQDWPQGRGRPRWRAGPDWAGRSPRQPRRCRRDGSHGPSRLERGKGGPWRARRAWPRAGGPSGR